MGTAEAGRVRPTGVQYPPGPEPAMGGADGMTIKTVPLAFSEARTFEGVEYLAGVHVVEEGLAGRLLHNFPRACETPGVATQESVEVVAPQGKVEAAPAVGDNLVMGVRRGRPLKRSASGS